MFPETRLRFEYIKLQNITTFCGLTDTAQQQAYPLY